MEDLLERYAQDDDDAFCRWAQRDAALAQYVRDNLRHLASALELTPAQFLLYSSVSLLQDGRDAACRLHMMARDAGFLDAATLFYAQYSHLCFALLPFFLS